MDKETLSQIIFYFIWGIFIGVASIMIRPFISLKQTLRDAIITFMVSFFSGLCLLYFESIPVPVVCGLSGVLGLFAVRIYIVIENFLKQVGDNPMAFIEKAKGKRHE